jgi:phenylacetate-CoA ligase
MEKVTGRSDDMIILRGVNVFPSQIEEQILRVAGLSPHYQLVLTRDEALDCMTVLVEAEYGVTGAERAAAAAALTHHVKEMVGVTVTVEVRDPGTVERSLGKAQRVVDRRHKA